MNATAPRLLLSSFGSCLLLCAAAATSTPLPAPATESQPLPDQITASEDAGDAASPDAAPVIAPIEPVRNPQAELQAAQALYDTAFAAEQYDEAAAAASQLAALNSELYGSESVEYALALNAQADAQRKTGQLATAARSYSRAIALLEDREGIVTPELIGPLRGLAEVQNATGNWDGALETWNRALRVNHVALGLNNNEQMAIRDGMTESYLGLGSIADANFQQEIQLRIVRDEYGNDLAKLVEASDKLADWYGRSNQQEKEVWQIESTVGLIRGSAGSNSTQQIQALRDLATAYQNLDLPEEQELNAYNAALAALDEAKRINDASSTPDKMLGAELEIAIGDVHNFFGAPRDARKAYIAGWQALTIAGASEDAVAGYFGAPTLIGKVRLPAVFPEDSKTRQLAQSNPDRFQPASLQALLDVNDFGRPDNIRIVESNPQDLLGDRALYLLKRYQYRPRFENGQPVATSDLSVSHAFKYLPEGQDATAQEQDSDEESTPLEAPEVQN